jgi:hypothetical protein
MLLKSLILAMALLFVSNAYAADGAPTAKEAPASSGETTLKVAKMT